jgi:hypothetical protein
MRERDELRVSKSVKEREVKKEKNICMEKKRKENKRKEKKRRENERKKKRKEKKNKERGKTRKI